MTENPPAAPAPGPLAPDRRSLTMDAVRGLAVLGILVMNILFFSMPIQHMQGPFAFGGDRGLDLLTWQIQSAFFDGKMRGIFSMLFGAGLLLQWRKAVSEGYAARFGDLWSRRCIWLVAFGMVHGYLLQWPGDILFAYGLAGLFLFPFRRLRPGRQLLAGILVMVLVSGLGLWPALQHMGMVAEFQEASTAQQAGTESTKSAQEAMDGWQEMLASRSSESEGAQEAVEAMRGGWLDSLFATAGPTFKMETTLTYLMLFWDALGLMLVGLALMHWGVFTGKARTSTYALLLAIGFGLAGTGWWWNDATWAGAGFPPDDVWHGLIKSVLYQPQRLLVALAHVSLLVLLVRARPVQLLLRPLQAVGRMAFSNYILQTVLCTTLFYGFGFGWYGHLSRSQQMLVVFAVWCVALLWSPLWLRAYRFGPLEWAWRSLVHWQRQPMRRR